MDNSDNRPDEFDGEIIPSEKVAKEVNESELLTTGGKGTEQNSNTKTSQPKSFNPDQGEPNKTKDNIERNTATVQNTEKSSSLDISSFLPSSLDENTDKNDLKVKQEIDSAEKRAVIDNNTNIIKNENITGLKKQDKKVMDHSYKACDVQFFQWLQDGVLSGKIKTNAAKARVHVVNDGVIVITPGIFQDFSKYTNSQNNWKDVQRLILKKKMHCRDKKGLNVIKYEVKGQSRTTKLNAILFSDPAIIFGSNPPPSQNPHLSRVE